MVGKAYEVGGGISLGVDWWVLFQGLLKFEEPSDETLALECEDEGWIGPMYAIYGQGLVAEDTVAVCSANIACCPRRSWSAKNPKKSN